MFERWKAHLTEDACYWYKRWSSWLAVIWGVVVAIFWDSPGWMSAIVAAVPQDVRSATSPVIWIVMTALPILIVQIKQKNIG